MLVVFRLISAMLLGMLLSSSLIADVRLPAIFGDHMVLQRDELVPIWGWAEPNEAVTVTILDQIHTVKTKNDGRWRIELKPEPAGGPHVMTITGTNKIELSNVMFGEVWICSGQSNMAWAVSSSDDADLESLTADYPNIRLISVPNVGTQMRQTEFQGAWQPCTPESVKSFSAVGYFFGRQLHQTLDVPVGLIDNAWGGSAVEAWIDRDVLDADESFRPLMEHWRKLESEYDYDEIVAEHQRKLKKWEAEAAAAKENDQQPPPRPRGPGRNLLKGNQRPGNLYAGVLHPLIGYRIRGAIWYQGESNASRAVQYRSLFPKMIQNWRDAWGQGDFSFYWVQLADFRAESAAPAESDWAELREAQTMAMQLPNTGQAVIVDLGEANDIHPRNKQDVANRLARWALARDYGFQLAHRSPQYKEMSISDGKVTLQFDHVGSGLRTFDVNQPRGFAIAGEDRRFVWANARMVDRQTIEVWSDDVPQPVAVRYAWGDNPVCNVQTGDGLPLTPFRTDDWPLMTQDKHVR